MRFFTAVFLLTLQQASFAESSNKQYAGDNKGASCYLSISLSSEYGDNIKLDECSAALPMNNRLKVVDGRILVSRYYGHISDEKDCSIKVELDAQNEPISASMKVGSSLSPIMWPKMSCKNLVRVK